jgi:hypothetical protein
VSTLGGAGLCVGVGAWLTGVLLTTVELVVVGLLEEELVVLLELEVEGLETVCDLVRTIFGGIITSLPYCFHTGKIDRKDGELSVRHKYFLFLENASIIGKCSNL